jgi:hypothetical protein
MPVAPIRKPAKPPPDPFDEEEPAEDEDLFPVFQTGMVAPPPIKERGRPGPKLVLPFGKLAINEWFLLPPLPVDKDARKKEKTRYANRVYTRPKGDLRRFKLIEIDEAFVQRLSKATGKPERPELVGRYGVWRVADKT